VVAWLIFWEMCRLGLSWQFLESIGEGLEDDIFLGDEVPSLAFSVWAFKDGDGGVGEGKSVDGDGGDGQFFDDRGFLFADGFMFAGDLAGDGVWFFSSFHGWLCPFCWIWGMF
jgi:hypothetical protein